jgi:hypothetical protein
MERTAINPSSWSVQLGFDQAQLIEGRRRELVCSAQDAVDATGNPQHPNDMAAQLGLEGSRFATTVLGVAKLAAPDLVVAIEATAMD